MLPTGQTTIISRSLGLLLVLLLIGQATIPLVPTIQHTRAATVSLDTEEAAFLPLINDFRQQNGISPLVASEPLTQSAEWMSQDMKDNNYFSHTDSQGRNVKTRLADFGIIGTIGENIAAGQISAETVFKAWKNSPGHRENMLNPNFKAIGISRVLSSEGKYRSYWTTDFSGSVDSARTASKTVDLSNSPAKQSLVTPKMSSLSPNTTSLARCAISFSTSEVVTLKLHTTGSNENECQELQQISPREASWKNILQRIFHRSS